MTLYYILTQFMLRCYRLEQSSFIVRTADMLTASLALHRSSRLTCSQAICSRYAVRASDTYIRSFRALQIRYLLTYLLTYVLIKIIPASLKPVPASTSYYTRRVPGFLNTRKSEHYSSLFNLRFSLTIAKPSIDRIDRSGGRIDQSVLNQSINQSVNQSSKQA